MCWNFEVSITTFAIGIMTALYLFRRRCPYDLMLGSLIFFYSFMQLFEALMHASNDPQNRNESLNLFATRCAYYLLWSHVLALGIGLYLEFPTQQSALVVAVGLMYLLVGFLMQPAFTPSGPTASSAPHLVYGFDPTFYMSVFAAAIVILLCFTDWSVTLPYLLFYVLTFIYTYFTNRESIASMWCWLCAFLSFTTLLFNC